MVFFLSIATEIEPMESLGYVSPEFICIPIVVICERAFDFVDGLRIQY